MPLPRHRYIDPPLSWHWPGRNADLVGTPSTVFSPQVTSFPVQMMPLLSISSSIPSVPTPHPMSWRESLTVVPAIPQWGLTNTQGDIGPLQSVSEIPIPSPAPGPPMFKPSTDPSEAQALARHGNIRGPFPVAIPPRTDGPLSSLDRAQDVQALKAMKNAFLQQVHNLFGVAPPQPSVGHAVLRGRSPFPRDWSPSYRSGRSPRGRSLSSRPSRTSPYCPRDCSRSKSPSAVGPPGFVPGPTISPTHRSSWRSPAHRSRSSFTDSGRRRRRHSADQRLLLLNAQPSRYSVQDRDTDQDICQSWTLQRLPLRSSFLLPLRTFKRWSRTVTSPPS